MNSIVTPGVWQADVGEAHKCPVPEIHMKNAYPHLPGPGAIRAAEAEPSGPSNEDRLQPFVSVFASPWRVWAEHAYGSIGFGTIFCNELPRQDTGLRPNKNCRRRIPSLI